MTGKNFSPKSLKVFYNGNIIDLGEFFYNLSEEEYNMTTLSKRHKEIHEGEYFSVSEIMTVSGEDKKTVCGTTGDKFIHVTPPIIKTSGPNVELRIYEDVEYTNGSAVDIFSHNRAYASNQNTHKWVDMVVDATVSDYGSENFYKDYVPGSTGLGGTSQGGQNSEIEEWIFKPSTKYAMDILNLDSDDDKVHVYFSWYWSNTKNG